jgi:hypothetical protein
MGAVMLLWEIGQVNQVAIIVSAPGNHHLIVKGLDWTQKQFSQKTPQARFELATNRLTADRSTTELLRNAVSNHTDK